MDVRTIATALMAAAITLGATGIEGTSQAADPYFVPYGAHRGRIRIGPHRARIHWGGGLTAYGAQVLTHGIDAFAPLVPLLVKSEDQPADDGGFSGASTKGAAAADLSAICERYAKAQEDANDLLRRSAALLGEDLGQPEKPVAPIPGNGAPDALPDPFSGASASGGPAEMNYQKLAEGVNAGEIRLSDAQLRAMIQAKRKELDDAAKTLDAAK